MRESKDSERRRAGWETRALGEQPQSTRRGEPGREADFCPRVKTFHPAPGASKDLAQVQSRATKCSPVQLPCTGSKVSLGRGAETGHRRSGRRTYSTFSAGPGGWERVEHPWPRKFTCTQIPQPARPPPRDGDRQGPASLWKCTAPESPARTSWRTCCTGGESETSCRKTWEELAVKNPPAVQETQETQVQSLNREDPLEEGTATHSSVLVWRIAMDRGAWWAAVHGVAKSWT